MLKYLFDVRSSACLSTLSCFVVAAALVPFASVASLAQTSVPPHQVTKLKDTSSLKPPSGVPIAVIEYEDLECPGCADAFPIVHASAARFHVSLEELDFQIPSHKWSHDAAVFAHYLKARVSPELAEAFRREVFAAQSRISSRDDLRRFAVLFMQHHGKQMPAAVDPTGEFSREVAADTAQGLKLGIEETPTIFVVTPTHWIEVSEPERLSEAIAQAQAGGRRPTPAAHQKAGR